MGRQDQIVANIVTEIVDASVLTQRWRLAYLAVLCA